MRHHFIKQVVALTALSALGACGEHGTPRGQSADHAAQADMGTTFSAEKITRTAEITLNGAIEDVFPLFNPVEEPKWAPQFQPTFLYPADQSVQVGMTFKTAGHGDEAELVWRINEYDTAAHHIQYLVFGTGRYWTITIDCREIADAKTSARVTYDFMPLDLSGAALNEASADAMFPDGVSHWEQAINHYLAGL